MIKKTRKQLLMGFVLASVAVLGACSNSTLAKPAVTFKGGNISHETIYNEANRAGLLQQTAYNLTLTEIFYKEFGDQVTNKEVNKQYKTYEDKYENKSDWELALKENGFTKESFKLHLKKQLAFEKGLDLKTKVTKAEIEEAWKTFMPDQKISIIATDNETSINEIKAKLDNGGEFDVLAKELSVLSEQGINFNLSHADKTIPEAIKNEIYNMNSGDVSNVLTDETYQVRYYFIVKMIEKTSKGDDLSKYKKEIEASLKAEKLSDQTIKNKIIKQIFKENNFNLIDKNYEQAFTDIVVAKDNSK